MEPALRASDLIDFWVEVHFVACSFELRVNDICILENNDGGQVTVDIPVNQWLLSGKNRFSVFMRSPILGHPMPSDAAFTVTVIARRRSTETSDVLSSRSFPEKKSSIGDVQSLESPQIVEWDFDVLAQIPGWRWQQGLKFSDSLPAEDLRKAIEVEMTHVWKMCSERDLDSLAGYFQRRNYELALAYHKTFDERVQEFRLEMENLFSGDLELGYLRTEDCQLRIYGNGRLARLESPHGESPLFFVNKEWTFATYLELVFMTESSGEVALIR